MIKTTLIAFAGIAATTLAWPGVYEHRINQLVFIESKATASGAYAGSGVIFGDRGAILTANHVIDNVEFVGVKDRKKPVKLQPRLTVTTHDNKKFSCTVGAKDKARDLAIINCAGLEGRRGVEGVGYLPLTVGDKVAIIANPLRIRRIMTTGTVALLDNAKGKVWLDATSGPGASGGPIFDEGGNLVGILQAGINGPFQPLGNLACISSQRQILNFLKTVKPARL